MIISGTTAVLPNYVAAISIITSSGTTDAVAEINPQNPQIWNYKAVDFSGSFNFATGTYYFDLENAGSGTSVVASYTEISTEIVRPEPAFEIKSSGNVSYLARPEDAPDAEFVDEVTDDYPWRRDLVGGGELVELDTYITSAADVAIDVVGDRTAVQAHTGVDMEVVGIPSSATGVLRLLYQDMPTDQDYAPSRLAVGYTGTFKDLSTLTPDEINLLNTENDLETLFEPGFSIYHIGLAQGVLVGDLPKFFGPHHRDGMVGWMAFNEHPEDDLTVVDHSSINSPAVLIGIDAEDRVWSNERGWYLSLEPYSTVFFNGYRGVADDQTVSFWINPSAVTDAGVTTIFEYGPLSFDLDNSASLISAYVGTCTPSGPIRQLIDTQSAPASQWTLFYIRKTIDTAVFGWGGNLSTAASETTVVASTGSFTPATPDDTIVTLHDDGLAFGVHDLRIWDEFKSQADMDLVRYHNPTSTICTYRLGFLQTVNKRDRYGFRVLPNGFATTGILPAWMRTVREGLVRRYDSTGAYTGESRFKEVGLGGGRPLPDTYQLGNQFTALTGTGTEVMATTHGEMPGYNAPWLNDSFSGTYAILNSGSTATGTNASYNWSGTDSPFPNPMVETNPNRDEIWVQGDDGYVYEVTLFGSMSATGFSASRIVRQRSDADLEINGILQVLNSTGSVFAVTVQGTIFLNQLLVTASSGSITSLGTNASTGAVSVTTNGTTQVSILHPLDLRYAEQPTGAQVILAGSGSIMSVTTDGSVYQKAWSGTLTTPPLFIYLNQRIVADAPNAWTQWTDNTNSAAFGNQQVPPVAALNQNGVLEFEDTGTLLAGLYELDVTSGNLGNPDPDFHGFDVQITINTTVLQTVLLQGKTGYNITGTDTFRFTLADGVIGSWLSSFQWTNAYANPQRGQARQLAIFNYQLRRLATELYQVDIAVAGTVPALTQMTTV